MRKFNMVFIVIGLVVMLSGCGKLDLQSSTAISPNGEGEFSFKFVYDDVVAGQCKNGFLTDKKNTPKEDVVMKYKNSNNKVDEYKICFKNLSELNKKVAAEQDDFEVRVKENKGLTKTTYTYEMRFKKPITPNSFKSYITQSDSIAAINQDNRNVENFLKEVSFTNAVRLPGKIISSNAVETKDNYLVWNYYLNQITPNTVMKATYEVENKTNKVVIGVTTVILAGAILCIIYNEKRKTKVS